VLNKNAAGNDASKAVGYASLTHSTKLAHPGYACSLIRHKFGLLN
jgi:hypothetical protein